MSSIALQFVLADELEVNVFASSAEAVARSQGRAALNVDLLGASVMEAQRQAMVTAPLAALPGVPIVVFGLAGVEGVAPALKLGARASITRPVTVEAVRQKVNAQIGRRSVLTISVVLGS